MSEWWTYRPSDFLMFSARAWGRLLEAWNRDLWPLQPALAAAGVVLIWLVARKPQAARRAVLAVLAAAWAWIAWAFHWERFAAINTGATWFAAAFAVQSVLLLSLGMRRTTGLPPRWLRVIGLGLAAAAVVLYPLAAPLTGRGWAQAEVAGAMPDPTALLTVGLLLALPQRHRAPVLVTPLLALVVGWTTAWHLWAS